MTDKTVTAQDGFDDMNYQTRLDYKYTDYAGLGCACSDKTVNPIPTYASELSTAENAVIHLIASVNKPLSPVSHKDVIAAGAHILIGHIQRQFTHDETTRLLTTLMARVADLEVA